MDPVQQKIMHSRYLTLREQQNIAPYIYLFGHCEASEQLADLFLADGFSVQGILDNSPSKYTLRYRDIPVLSPETVLKAPAQQTMVCIASRFYEAMYTQLRRLGYTGRVEKMADYNTYAEYSLSDETFERMQQREQHGEALLSDLASRYPGAFRVFCPFPALGDVYLCMAYLPAFLQMRGISGDYMICCSSRACAQVAALFGAERIAVYEQAALDALIQAVLYTRDARSYIAHQDRPYVVQLHRALSIRCIPLEIIYRCGVFGLPMDTQPVEATVWRDWPDLAQIPEGRAIILSPYAKSVTALPDALWREIVDKYASQGLALYTNVAGDEQPLPGTRPICAPIAEMRSIVERAGCFIALRSGLCDVLRTAQCRKVALYPDYYYSDTRWKAIDMYAIEGFENYVIEEGTPWTIP